MTIDILAGQYYSILNILFTYESFPQKSTKPEHLAHPANRYHFSLLGTALKTGVVGIHIAPSDLQLLFPCSTCLYDRHRSKIEI